MDELPLPRISVWMITFNHRPYIRQAVESVLAQRTSFPFEIVIGDDCSTDGTREILLALAAEHPGRLRLLLHERNIGMIANQNAVFAACRGHYIAMLEGDDYWTDPRKLQVQAEAMDSLPGCWLSFHPCIESRHGRRMSWLGMTRKVVPVQDVILGGGYFCPTASLMLRREVVASLPAFLLDAPAGDYYLQILGAEHAGALYLPVPMCVYRVNASGSWSLSVSNFHSKQSFRHRTLAAMDQLDAYLGHRHHVSFEAKKAELHLVMAFDYLMHGDPANFRTHLALSRTLRRRRSLRYQVVATLQHLPWLLRMIHRTLKAVRAAFYRVRG